MAGPIGETFATPDDFGDIRSSDLHASLGERLAAQAADALDPQSGFSAMQIFRRTQRALAGGDISPPGLYTLGEAVPGDLELADQIMAAQKAAIPDTAIEDARKRVKEEGLEGHLKLPDQPSIKSPVLDLMVQEAHERRDRELAIARGPQGFMPDALGFVTGIGAGMIDPVNMAAFSIPVVGEARFGRMLASAGESLAARAAVRAGVGAAQGAAGTGVLQPADWWLHTQDGLDYTMTDALRSIVMGAGMGAAFHAGGGAIGDMLARRAGRPLPGSPEDLLARALAAPGRPAGEPGAAGLPSEAPPDFANAGTPGEEIPGIAPSTRVTAQPIFEALRDQMVAAGRPEDEANQVAAVIAARYATRAQRLGRPDQAEQLAREAGIDIRPGGELAEEGRAYAQNPERGRWTGAEPTEDAQWESVAHLVEDRPDLDSQFRNVLTEVSEGGKFKDAMERHGSPELARLFGGELSSAASKVSFAERLPEGGEIEHDHEHLPEHGENGPFYYDVAYTDDGRAVVSNVRGGEEEHLEPASGLLNRMQLRRLQKEIANTIQGHLEDRAEEAAELKRWEALTPPQQAAELAEQERARAERDNAHSKQINAAVDAALARGWRPEFNQHGGWKRPSELEEFASPASLAKIKSRLAERLPETKRFFQRKTAPPGPNLFTQREAEGQANLPGTERISEAELAKRRAAEPLKPGVAQKPMDVGLFSDEAKQKSFFQRAQQAPPGELETAPGASSLHINEGETLRGHPIFEVRDSNTGEIRDTFGTAAEAEQYIETNSGGRRFEVSWLGGNDWVVGDRNLRGTEDFVRSGHDSREEAAQEAARLNKQDRERPQVKVHTLDITPQLREAATEQGFPLFQKGAEGEPQGRVTFADNKRIVELFKSANASTAMHELGHVWLEELVADAGRADAPPALRNDLATVLKWLGVEKPEDIGTPHHEQFARGFEQYLRDGNAPSSALAAAFEKFKAWLTAIYRSLTELGTPISDEMRGVFDRMLATDAEIAAAHPASKLADLPPRVREDALRATVADITAGNTARTGEMLEEAAKEDPRIAESLRPRSLAAETPSGTTTVRQFGAFEPSASAPASAVRTGVPHIDAVLAQPDVAAAIADPKVNRSQDVPYTAGPDRTGPGLNIDRHLPATLTTASGKTFDPAKPYAVHEFVERHVINELIAGGMDQGTAYKVAHWEYAEPAEAAWYRANDIDPAEAEAAAQPYIDKIEHEKLAKGDGDVPPNLFKKPYPHDSVDAAAQEKAPVPKPTAEEIARGREILAKGEGSHFQTTITINGKTRTIKGEAKRGPRARPEETWSLNEFIASKGGIDPADPMIADVRGSIGRPNKFVPGFGNLVAAPGKGVRLDRLREAAVEAGYIHDEGNVTGGLATSTVNTLLDAIDAELRGRRVYRQGVAAAERSVDPAQRDHELNAYLDQELHAAGINPDTVTGKYRDRVLEIMDRERQHPHDALERAAMEDTASGAEAGQVKPKPEAIPGWDIPDDTGSAPGAGGQVAGGRDAAGQPAGRPARDRGQGGRSQGKADWQGLADARRPDDEDLAVASRQADKTPEPASLDPEKSPSAAEAAAREADALLAELLPRLTDDERRIFEDALARLDREKAADEAIARDGAACLAAAVA